ncbi:5-hydroxytryptamine receptor 1B [Eurytemora carolleeae]|uniref:5-hydroxytryptamine receptor 1B n=1 Tax=Eurytemora carolleeae TaxID=1294199 RepID=UPI000C787241|nr:5-hydroxytryptamine receptor 1B [Eurytemora carolleeae]|eukprot:XP_023339557.1 5-hydroxytryptamine receptor 1B-like [Eurytemora affinis]
MLRMNSSMDASSDPYPEQEWLGREEVIISTVEVIFIVYLCIVFILACICNVSILLAFFRKSSLRTTSNRFVIQLLIVNLLCCCMLLPLTLLELIFTIPGQCSLSETVACWISSLSVLSTVLIGGDQYLAVKFPLRYRHHVSRTRAYIAQLCVCTLSTLLAILWALAPPPNPVWRSCPPNQTRIGILTGLCSCLTILLSFILPTLTLTVIYCKIFTEAHNNSVRTRRNSLNPSENLYSLTSTMVAPLTISQSDLKKINRVQSFSHSPISRSEPLLVRQGSLHHVHRSPTHLKTNLNQLRHRISNASQIMHREEGRTARLYTFTLASILICWSPYFIYSAARTTSCEEEGWKEYIYEGRRSRRKERAFRGQGGSGGRDRGGGNADGGQRGTGEKKGSPG